MDSAVYGNQYIRTVHKDSTGRGNQYIRTVPDMQNSNPEQYIRTVPKWSPVLKSCTCEAPRRSMACSHSQSCDTAAGLAFPGSYQQAPFTMFSGSCAATSQPVYHHSNVHQLSYFDLSSRAIREGPPGHSTSWGARLVVRASYLLVTLQLHSWCR
jgi:hypothetical protein